MGGATALEIPTLDNTLKTFTDTGTGYIHIIARQELIDRQCVTQVEFSGVSQFDLFEMTENTVTSFRTVAELRLIRTRSFKRLKTNLNS